MLVMLFIYFLYINIPLVNEKLYVYSRYVFQFAYNYFNTGSASVSSLEGLQNMYFYPDGDLIFGHGKYTNESGGYYLGTDAGYMRFLLYFGGVGSLLIYGVFIFPILYVYLIKPIKLNGLLFGITLILMTFILHYKGEVVLYNVAYMKVVFFVVFNDYFKKIYN